MNVLLSAFACAPERGSEPGVGWNWAETLASQGHSVTVLTQERNRTFIDAFYTVTPQNISFIYVSLFKDGPIPGGTAGHYIYYFIWQCVAFARMCWRGSYKTFDFIHHVTYGGIRTWSLLCLLPRPFMFGPVGGGETCPTQLVVPFGRKAVAIEVARKVLNALNRIDPIFVTMQARAVRILVKTPETQQVLLPWFRSKSLLALEIGAPTVALSEPARAGRTGSGAVRVLFAGRLIYWKGADIVVDALRLLEREGDAVHLTIVGRGARERALRDKIRGFKVVTCDIVGHVPQVQLFSMYGDADVFVFPSLHDSSGNVVLEAMAFGLPVVCLDLGGPPLIVGDAGVVIATKDRSYGEVCAALAESLRELVSNQDLRIDLAARARERAASLTWSRAVREGYAGLQAPQQPPPRTFEPWLR